MDSGYEWSTDKDRRHEIAAGKNGSHIRPALYWSSRYKRLHSKDILVYSKTLLSGHFKIDKIKVLMEFGSLMKVSNTFDLH